MITLLLSNKGLRWMCAFTKPISETFVEFYYRHLNRPTVFHPTVLACVMLDCLLSLKRPECMLDY